MVGKPSYWLMKSEPDVFSIHDLRDCGVTGWDGVRNYQARNYLRTGMKVGDGVLFYHSNCRQSGISGIAKVVKGGYPDDTAFDPEDEHYDPKSDPKHPTWFRVDLKFIRAFPSVIPIPLLRKTPGLEKMVLFRNGRLSVQPVAKKEWAIIVDLAKRMRSLKTPKSRSRR